MPAAFLAPGSASAAATLISTPSGNVLLRGGGVVNTSSSYAFTVSAAEYLIQGVLHTSPQTNVTLATAHETLDRYDVIAVDNTGAVVVITGTPGANPAEPDTDPNTQLGLTFVYVAAGSTSADTITTDIYHENAEWTSSKSGNPINLASTSNPRGGTKCVEATVAVNGNYAQFANAATLDLATRNNLVFYLRSKAAWTATLSLVVAWYNGTTRKGSVVSIKTGQYGFNSSTTGSYQQITIPLSAFGLSGVLVDRVRFTITGSGAGIGFHLDDVTLQGGVAVPSATPARNAVIEPVVFGYTTDVTTGDGAAYCVIPSALNGLNLIRVHARVITAGTTGTTDIQIANVTQSADMLSSKLKIDSGETGSDTAATPAVIDTGNDDVATNDLLRIDVDATATTKAKGLLVTMEFG